MHGVGRVWLERHMWGSCDSVCENVVVVVVIAGVGGPLLRIQHDRSDDERCGHHHGRDDEREGPAHD